MNIDKPVTISFDTATGLAKTPALERRLSQMKGMFADEAAFDALLANDDPVIYRFYDFGVPERDTDLAFGTSITYPGTVGDEFNFTKGHYHVIRGVAEVYYCLGGKGVMLMETEDGLWAAEDMQPGSAVYVPGGWAHRSVNVGDEPLITFFAFRADAGHDYATIETKGYRKLIVKKDDGYEVIDNPKWK